MSCPLKRFPVNAKVVGSEETNPERVRELNDKFKEMMAARQNLDKINTYKEVDITESKPEMGESVKSDVKETQSAFEKMMAERERQDKANQEFFSQDEFDAKNGKGPGTVK